MKIVRDDAARWLPSRHRYALMRLVAYVVSLRRRPAARQVMLMIDRDQSQLENYALSIVYLALATCYAAELLPMTMPLKAIAALPIATAVIQVPMVAVGLVPRRLRPDASSFVLMALMFAASAWMAMRPSWVRIPAYAFLALFVTNALAAVVLFALRGRVAELERRCGA